MEKKRFLSREEILQYFHMIETEMNQLEEKLAANLDDNRQKTCRDMIEHVHTVEMKINQLLYAQASVKMKQRANRKPMMEQIAAV